MYWNDPGVGWVQNTSGSTEEVPVVQTVNVERSRVPQLPSRAGLRCAERGCHSWCEISGLKRVLSWCQACRAAQAGSCQAGSQHGGTSSNKIRAKSSNWQTYLLQLRLRHYQMWMPSFPYCWWAIEQQELPLAVLLVSLVWTDCP